MRTPSAAELSRISPIGALRFVTYRSVMVVLPDTETDQSRRDHVVGVDDEFFGGAFVEVFVAFGGFVERDGGDVDGFGDLDFVVEDALHEVAVVTHDGALAGGQAV